MTKMKLAQRCWRELLNILVSNRKTCDPTVRPNKIITVLPKPSDEEREDWTRLSLESLARAYSDDEPEYSLDLIKEANPAYMP
jgi:hypothetical protein